MDQENTVSPDVDTQIPTPELTNETPEVVTPEATEVDAQPKEAAPDEDPVAKSLRRMERRIDRVSAARHQAEARADQAAQEAAQLRAELEKYRQPQEEQPAAKREPQPDPYAIAREIRDVEKVTETSNAIWKDGAKRFPDFDKALGALHAEAPIFDRNGRPTVIGKAIFEAEDKAGLLHYLGSDPDLAAELSTLSEFQVGRRLDRLEREMAEAKKPKSSSAPQPLTPVKPSAPDTSLSSAKSDEEWARMRDRELAERRRNR